MNIIEFGILMDKMKQKLTSKYHTEKVLEISFGESESANEFKIITTKSEYEAKTLKVTDECFEKAFRISQNIKNGDMSKVIFDIMELLMNEEKYRK